MDHSENDKRFCVYVHKDQDGNVRYVGSGVTGRRPYRKEGRSKEHKNMFDNLVVEILQDNLCKQEANLLEQKVIDEFKNSGLLFNKVTSVINFFEIEYSYISKFLYYSESSSTYLRRMTKTRNYKRGSVTGSRKPNSSGYIRCSILKRQYLAHRVIYCLYNKVDLPNNLVIDHIDGDKSNNHPSNLRAVTLSDNCKNTPESSNNTSGKKGVAWHKQRHLWIAHWRLEYNLKTKAFNPRMLYPELSEEDGNKLAFEDACKFRDEINTLYFQIEDRLSQHASQ